MPKTVIALKRNILILAVLLSISLVTIAFLLPTNADAAMLTQQLDFGMTNSDVGSLQTFLASNSSIYPEAIISSYFGTLTRAAVSRFQTANGLPSVGRVGPLTLATINAQMGGNTTPSGDISAPIMYPETISTGTNSVNISWTTGESARSRVLYGTSWPFLYAIAPSVSTSGYGATASIAITGLQSKTTYYYVRESIDTAGNVMWTSARPVTTQ